MVSEVLEGMIAERRLTLITDDGETRDIVVRIGKPEPSPDRIDFSCEYQIVGLGDRKVSESPAATGFTHFN
jgi:hypothetical protein